MIPQTNTDRVKEENSLELAADKYRQSMYPNDPSPIGYYNEAGCNGFIAGAKWQSYKSYTPSEVTVLLEKFRERCIVASSDFLSEGNIREIDYSDLLNK